MPGSPERSNASASLFIGLAAAVIVALGVGVLVYTRQPAPLAPAPVSSAAATTPASAPPTAAPEPAPEASAAAPNAQPPAAGQGAAPAPPSATSRSSGGKPSGASAPANKGKSTPAPASAKPEKVVPPAAPLTAQAMLRRTFVTSRTASESIRGISKTLSGFDSQRPKEVTVKRAPEIDGRIEFSASPAKVKPGDKYSVRVLLINEGKRTIEIKELEVATAQNGKLSSSAVKPRARQVAPRQNEVIHEISGTWDRNTTSFTVSVRVMSERLDLYRNQLAWK